MPKDRKTRSVSFERRSRGSPYPPSSSNGWRSHRSSYRPSSSNGRLSHGSPYPPSSYNGRRSHRSPCPPSSSYGRRSRGSPYPPSSSNGRRSRGSPCPPSSTNGRRSRGSPCPLSSSNGRWASCQREKVPESSAATKSTEEWEQARCPVCMEHPHNAVLLVCSSHDKGCRPFMCNTSHRHSNCLDQYRKSAGSTTECSECQQAAKLTCPLCRGTVTQWKVVEDARVYMNSKVRNCSKESCEFKGVYRELREHARNEHPTACPSEVDPERQENWQRMEQQRDFGDLLSMLSSGFVGNDDRFGLSEDEEESNGRVIRGTSFTMVFVIRSGRSIFRYTSSSSPGGSSGSRRGRAIFLIGEGSNGPVRATATSTVSPRNDAANSGDVPVADYDEDDTLVSSEGASAGFQQDGDDEGNS